MRIDAIINNNIKHDYIKETNAENEEDDGPRVGGEWFTEEADLMQEQLGHELPTPLKVPHDQERDQ